MSKRWVLAAALCFALPAWAEDLVMAVSEGTSGGLDHAQVIAKYQGLADTMGKAVKRCRTAGLFPLMMSLAILVSKR